MQLPDRNYFFGALTVWHKVLDSLRILLWWRTCNTLKCLFTVLVTTKRMFIEHDKPSPFFDKSETYLSAQIQDPFFAIFQEKLRQFLTYILHFFFSTFPMLLRWSLKWSIYICRYGSKGKFFKFTSYSQPDHNFINKFKKKN